MYNKVFISYATEDYSFAFDLYTFLDKHGFQPWLDKLMMLPGQNWDLEINRALRNANYIILLLSDTSVRKRGYVQKEFRLALKYFEEKLEDDIYLIPLKINDCQVPESLLKFQWIEYESHECFGQILKALKLQRDKYMGSTSIPGIPSAIDQAVSIRSTYRVRVLNSDGDLHYERYFYVELQKDVEMSETRIDMMGAEVRIEDFPPEAKVLTSIPKHVVLNPTDVTKYESIRGGRRHYDYTWRYKIEPALKQRSDFLEYGYSAIIPKCEPQAFADDGALFFFYHEAVAMDVKYSLLAPHNYCITIMDYWIEDSDGHREQLEKSEAPFLDETGQMLTWLPGFRRGYCFICRYRFITASVHWVKPQVELS